jgi:hypothetical protein
MYVCIVVYVIVSVICAIAETVTIGKKEGMRISLWIEGYEQGESNRNASQSKINQTIFVKKLTIFDSIDTMSAEFFSKDFFFVIFIFLLFH